MIQYPIINNVNTLSTNINSIILKIVTNLQAKGITDVDTTMSLTQLINKITDITYQPVSEVKNFRSMEPSILQDTLTILNTKLNTLIERFILNLTVMGVKDIPSNPSLTVLADKILEIAIAPEYSLLPTHLNIPADGTAQEFYFNTSEALKVTFRIVDDPNNYFTIDRTTGQGPASFIIKVSATNNTTTDKRLNAKVEILIDGKWKNQVTLEQARGVQNFILTNPIALEGNSFNASGKNTIDTSINYTTFQALYNTLWNGIISESITVDGNSSDFSIAILGDTNNYTITNTPKYGTLVASNTGTTLTNLTNTVIECRYKGAVTQQKLNITQQENKVIEYVEPRCALQKGTSGEFITTAPAKGILKTTILSEGYLVCLFAKKKYTSESVDINEWKFPNSSITTVTTLQGAAPYKIGTNNAISVQSKGITHSAVWVGIITNTCTSSEGFVVSGKMNFSQEANIAKDKRISLALKIGTLSHSAAGGTSQFTTTLFKEWTSGEENIGATDIGALFSTNSKFTVSNYNIISQNRGIIEGNIYSTTITSEYNGLTAPETFVITQEENSPQGVSNIQYSINKTTYSAGEDVVIITPIITTSYTSGTLRNNHPIGDFEFVKTTVPSGSSTILKSIDNTELHYTLNSRNTVIDVGDNTKGDLILNITGEGMPLSKGLSLIVNNITRIANKEILSDGIMVIPNIKDKYSAGTDNFTFKVTSNLKYTSGTITPVVTYDSVTRNVYNNTSATIDTFNTNGIGSGAFSSLNSTETIEVNNTYFKVKVIKNGHNLEITSPMINRESNRKSLVYEDWVNTTTLLTVGDVMETSDSSIYIECNTDTITRRKSSCSFYKKTRNVNEVFTSGYSILYKIEKAKSAIASDTSVLNECGVKALTGDINIKITKTLMSTASTYAIRYISDVETVGYSRPFDLPAGAKVSTTIPLSLVSNPYGIYDSQTVYFSIVEGATVQNITNFSSQNSLDYCNIQLNNTAIYTARPNVPEGESSPTRLLSLTFL